jgi:ligand-binding SRPBCC domain-containing protein
MKIHTVKYEQFVPVDLATAWDFFSSPKNLAKITPQHMGFQITNKYDVGKMYPGMLITYKVSPLLGIKLDWCTEITHVKDQVYFVDEQRFGPYAMWHHQHHFEVVEGGVMMTDIVDYAISFGIFGSIVNVLLVKNAVKEIFEFRKHKIAELF